MSEGIVGTAVPGASKLAQRRGEIMKCEWVQENILLHIYNELADDARYELEQHVARCTECAAELKAARKLHATISQFPVEEPTPNLIAASRMRLQEALETTEQGGFWQRLVFDPGAWLRPISLAPRWPRQSLSWASPAELALPTNDERPATRSDLVRR